MAGLGMATDCWLVTAGSVSLLSPADTYLMRTLMTLTMILTSFL